MTVKLELSVTQGDLFYHEIGYADVYGHPIDLTGWTFQVDFKAQYADAAAMLSLTALNGGIGFVNNAPANGIIYLTFAGTAFAGLAMPTAIRPGYSAPFQIVHGDIKAVPPNGVMLTTADGARPIIALTVYQAVTA